MNVGVYLLPESSKSSRKAWRTPELHRRVVFYAPCAKIFCVQDITDPAPFPTSASQSHLSGGILLLQDS